VSIVPARRERRAPPTPPPVRATPTTVGPTKSTPRLVSRCDARHTVASDVWAPCEPRTGPTFGPETRRAHQSKANFSRATERRREATRARCRRSSPCPAEQTTEVRAARGRSLCGLHSLRHMGPSTAVHMATWLWSARIGRARSHLRGNVGRFGSESRCWGKIRKGCVSSFAPVTRRKLLESDGASVGAIKLVGGQLD